MRPSQHNFCFSHLLSPKPNCDELLAIFDRKKLSKSLYILVSLFTSPFTGYQIFLHTTWAHLFSGAIDHGTCKHFFLDFLEYGKGANLGCSAMLHTLIQHVQMHGSLPPKLVLQADNTTSDYKNHATIYFLAYLVSRGVFEEVNHFCLVFYCSHVSGILMRR